MQNNSELIESVNSNAKNITAVGQNIASVNTVSSGMSYIQSAAQNIGAIQAAPSAASEASASANSASSSATLSESWAVGGTGTRYGEDTNNAKYYAEQAQSIGQGQLGWYATPQALRSAHPTGQNGQWAIVGTTDTIWTWDRDTSAWVDSGSQVDLSDYYTKTQTKQIVPFLYKATFRVNSWSGYTGNYYQTAYVTAMDGGPSITSSSVMVSGLFCDDTVQGEAQTELLEAASIVDKGTKTFGSNTITCTLTGDKPTADAEVYFMARKGSY